MARTLGCLRPSGMFQDFGSTPILVDKEVFVAVVEVVGGRGGGGEEDERAGGKWVPLDPTRMIGRGRYQCHGVAGYRGSLCKRNAEAFLCQPSPCAWRRGGQGSR